MARYSQDELVARRVTAMVAPAATAIIRRRRAGLRSIGPSRAEAAREEADAMRVSGSWAGAGALHLAMLHAMMHAHVYEVEAAEGEGKALAIAASAARRMLEQEFGGDPEAMVDYMRWAWQREHGRERWRRENGKPGGRLDWHKLFVQRRLLTDYRVEAAREGGAR